MAESAPHDEREELAQAHYAAYREQSPGRLTWENDADFVKDRMYGHADVALAAGYGKPRVQPTVEDVARTLAKHGYDNLDDAVRCICGSRLWTLGGGFIEGPLRMNGSIAETAMNDHLARAVLALFANQPTVQDVREQVAAELPNSIPGRYVSRDYKVGFDDAIKLARDVVVRGEG